MLVVDACVLTNRHAPYHCQLIWCGGSRLLVAANHPSTPPPPLSKRHAHTHPPPHNNPQAFKSGGDADKVFFAELSYEGSKELYKRLNVKSLPFIFHWGPEAVAKEGRSIKISKASQVCV